MERTPDRVVFVQGNEELDKILEHPFAAWRIFLHPAQRKIAYALRYAGPAHVPVEREPGRTVTALHRAAYLARRAAQTGVGGAVSRIRSADYFYPPNLAEALLTQFELLVDDQDTRGQSRSGNVDSLAHRVVEHAGGGAKPVISMGKEPRRPVGGAAVQEAALPYVHIVPLNREWEQVILCPGPCAPSRSILTASRAGQGTPLGKAQRHVRCGR